MEGRLFEELGDSTYAVLEAHVSYANAGEGEHVRHFLPVEFLQALSWLCVSVLIPTLTGAAGTLIAEYLKRPKGQRAIASDDNPRTILRSRLRPFWSKRPLLNYRDVPRLREEARTLLIRHSGNFYDLSRADEAHRMLTEILYANGWPASIAEEDATRIVSATWKVFGDNSPSGRSKS
jgi:hypothetical protein